MKSKDYLNDALVKQAFDKSDFALGAAKQMGYFIPGVGGAMSAGDALRNIGGMGKAIGKGSIKGFLSQLARFGGNSLMAAADFVPFLGTAARGMIRGGIGATKALKGVKAIDRSLDATKGIKKTFLAKGLGVGKGKKALKPGGIYDKFSDALAGGYVGNSATGLGKLNPGRWYGKALGAVDKRMPDRAANLIKRLQGNKILGLNSTFGANIRGTGLLVGEGLLGPKNIPTISRPDRFTMSPEQGMWQAAQYNTNGSDRLRQLVQSLRESNYLV